MRRSVCSLYGAVRFVCVFVYLRVFLRSSFSFVFRDLFVFFVFAVFSAGELV